MTGSTNTPATSSTPAKDGGLERAGAASSAVEGEVVILVDEDRVLVEFTPEMFEELVAAIGGARVPSVGEEELEVINPHLRGW
jgi:hypothetical protein